jgi:hypothetical protein
MHRERRSRKAGARLGEPQKAREEKQLLPRARRLRGLWEPLRVAGPRSVARRRRPPRFMVPMRFKIELEAFHERERGFGFAICDLFGAWTLHIGHWSLVIPSGLRTLNT